MKTIKITLSRNLVDVELTVQNYSRFIKCYLSGTFCTFDVKISDIDLPRVKKELIKVANDKSSNHGRWYAHCNGYMFDCILHYTGAFSINTGIGYRNPRMF